VAALQAEIDAMDSQIAELTVQIETERTEVAALARAVYRRPNNLLDIIASSGSLSDMLTQTEDLVVAAQRAHELQDSLEGNKQRLQTDRDTRQSALDQQTASLQQVQAGLSQLTGVQTELGSLAGQLTALIALIRADASKVNNMPADVAAQLATLLEQEEHNLANQEQAAAWAQASIGAGQAADQNLLPGGTEPTGGISLNWLMNGAVITQPFGPTNFVLEPPLGQYAHFHTGIDIATPIGTPVFAAATGLVVVVAHTSVGYGNYVIIAHGFGVMTLYAHLLETDAYIGEPVIAGQQIGREGTSGFSTGPHVHFEVRIDGKVVDPMKFLPPQN
jgi:murein DD-endopeptidase MepM/ murein hydrolase activator NlpD